MVKVNDIVHEAPLRCQVAADSTNIQLMLGPASPHRVGG